MYVWTGGLVLGLTLSSSARDLHEVLHEELIECSFINHVHPWGTDTRHPSQKSIISLLILPHLESRLMTYPSRRMRRHLQPASCRGRDWGRI